MGSNPSACDFELVMTCTISIKQHTTVQTLQIIANHCNLLGFNLALHGTTLHKTVRDLPPGFDFEALCHFFGPLGLVATKTHLHLRTGCATKSCWLHHLTGKKYEKKSSWAIGSVKLWQNGHHRNTGGFGSAFLY